MIPKAERDADRAICEAASSLPWFEVDDDMVSENRCAGIRSSDPEASEIVTTDSGYYGPTAADAEAICNAVNRLPLYIAALDEMEKRIELASERARMLLAAQPDSGGIQIHTAGMREALRILRGAT